MKRVCAKCGRSTVVYDKDRKARARLANREDFILLLARRERIVNPMAGCEKVLYAIRPAMAEEDVTMGVNRFYRLMKKNGMMVPKRKKYSCTTDRLNGILKYEYFLNPLGSFLVRRGTKR